MPLTFVSEISGKEVTIKTTSEMGWVTRKPGDPARLICDKCNRYTQHKKAHKDSLTEWNCTVCQNGREWG